MDLQLDRPTPGRQVVATFVMLMGSMLWGQVLATFCGVVATFNPEAAEFRRTMDDLNKFMSRQVRAWGSNLASLKAPLSAREGSVSLRVVASHHMRRLPHPAIRHLLHFTYFIYLSSNPPRRGLHTRLAASYASTSIRPNTSGTGNRHSGSSHEAVLCHATTPPTRRPCTSSSLKNKLLSAN